MSSAVVALKARPLIVEQVPGTIRSAWRAGALLAPRPLLTPLIAPHTATDSTLREKVERTVSSTESKDCYVQSNRVIFQPQPSLADWHCTVLKEG